MRKLLQILPVLLILSCPSLAAESQLPTCAVLTFDSAGDATPGEAGMLSNMISVDAARSGKYSVIPRYKLNQTLDLQRYNRKSYKSTNDAGLAAGRALKADYVIIGTLSRNGAKNEASSILLDTTTGRITEQMQLANTGDADSFRSKAAHEISRKLIGAIAVEAPAQVFAKIESPPAEKPMLQKPTEPARPLKPIEVPAAKPSPVNIERPLRTSPIPSPATPSAKPEEHAPIKSAKNYEPDAASKCAAAVQLYWGELQKASAGRLEAGIRFRKLSLKKDTDDSFLGSINTLDLENDGVPAELFAVWFFNDYVGVEVSWFNLRARTVTDPAGFSDGAICVSGPTLALAGKYEGYRPWIPFATLGIGSFSANFDHQDWWHYGYPSLAEWEEQGSPSYSMSGKIRTMDLADTIGMFFVIGLRYAADAHWAFELAYRTMALEVDDRFTIDTPSESLRDYGTTTFPLDNTSILVGARYSF